MKKLFQVGLAFFAVTFLTAYFFTDLDITGRSEMMTWEEFSNNPLSVEHFRERAGLSAEEVPVGEQATRRAYERYVSANTGAPGVFSGLSSSAGDRLQAFRETWHRVYRLWPNLPKLARGGRKKKSVAAAGDYSERVGPALTFLALAAVVGGLSLAIQYAEEKARV